MSQFNMHITPDFEQALTRLMKRRGCKTRAEAVRLAVIEAAQRRGPGESEARPSFRELVGLGAGPGPHPPRFADDAAMWDAG